MNIWQNDQPEELHFEEAHNKSVNSINKALAKLKLNSEVIECELPKIQRSIWKDDAENKTELLIHRFEGDEHGFTVSYSVMYPEAGTDSEGQFLILYPGAFDEMFLNLLKPIAKFYADN